MKDWLFQRTLQRLERAGNNDLLLIMEFGASSYSTEELRQLLAEVEQQKQLANLWQNRIFLVYFSISFWIAASVIASANEAHTLSNILLGMVPASLLIAVVGHTMLRYRYPSLRDNQIIASIVQQELDRRKKDASIF